MPFFLTNAPLTFQSLMNSISKYLIINFLLVFFDDILIYNKSWEEHVQHVDMVLIFFEEKQLYTNPSKCSIGVQEVKNTSHIVSLEGVKVDPNKIKIMLECIIMKKLNNIRGFLGLKIYYHNFVKNYGQIETPITTLLKNEAFSWTQKATKDFEKIKEAMCMNHVLATPNFTKIFIVECDS
jgi:hypothetical protein